MLLYSCAVLLTFVVNYDDELNLINNEMLGVLDWIFFFLFMRLVDGRP